MPRTPPYLFAALLAGHLGGEAKKAFEDLLHRPDAACRHSAPEAVVKRRAGHFVALRVRMQVVEDRDKISLRNRRDQRTHRALEPVVVHCSLNVGLVLLLEVTAASRIAAFEHIFSSLCCRLFVQGFTQPTESRHPPVLDDVLQHAG